MFRGDVPLDVIVMVVVSTGGGSGSVGVDFLQAEARAKRANESAAIRLTRPF
jgi:hypothetical protein